MGMLERAREPRATGVLLPFALLLLGDDDDAPFFSVPSFLAALARSSLRNCSLFIVMFGPEAFQTSCPVFPSEGSRLRRAQLESN